MTVFPSSAVRISAKVLPRFPASVTTSAGLAHAYAGGALDLALDYPSLVTADSIADPSTVFIAIYDADADAYRRIRPDQIVLPTAGVRTPRGDADYVMLNTDRYVGLSAELTAPRTFTLPAASGVTGGTVITVNDEAGGIDSTNTLTIAAAGSDEINGATTYVVSVPFGGASFVSDGAGAWSTAVLAIGSDAVATANIQDEAVTTAKIAAAAVTTAKIADANVTADKIAADSVTTGKIADLNVTAAKLAADAVTTTKILDANVTTAKIADSNVTTAKIADSNVTTAKINDGAVTTAKINDGAVTYAKMTLGAGAAVAMASTALTAYGGPYSETIPLDDTIPQSSEGRQIQTLDFALTNSANKVKFCWTGYVAPSTTTNATVAIFVDSATSATAAAAITCSTSGHLYCLTVEGEYSPGDTSTHTYKVRIGGTAGNIYINGNSGGRFLGGVMECRFTATECEV